MQIAMMNPPRMSSSNTIRIMQIVVWKIRMASMTGFLDSTYSEGAPLGMDMAGKGSSMPAEVSGGTPWQWTRGVQARGRFEQFIEP
mmetsp:Transcript_44979/g.104037  ORF Transcript_44979/g.104037 Transcript_44979/m.104037 type:complete len:86 (-) Transcript_44979:16-273(-)